jgi:hypothetical protein
MLLSIAAAGFAYAQDESNVVDRFAGETRIGSQPPLPIHLDLRQTGSSVEGTISIPMGGFEIVATRQGGAIAGRFAGAGGEGPLTLIIDADTMTGTFTLGQAQGVITAQRTTLDAEAFFKPPEEKLDLTKAQWIEDLDRLAEILMREHASPFHRISRQQFESEVARARAAIPALKGIAVALEFHRLGALIGDGHTGVALPHDRPRLPVEFFWFKDGLRVVGVSATHQKLLASQLVAVNGVPVEEALDRLRPFIPAGETEWFVQAAMPALIADPDVLAAVGLADGPSVALSLKETNGERTSIELAATHDTVKQAALGGGEPLWRQNGTKSFWTAALADGSIYLNWRSYDDLAAHAAALLHDLDAQHPPRLIIDLRDNRGGDFSAGRAFIEEIKRRPWLRERGALYVLVGRDTFSAAMTNAVDFKAQTNAILVGETVGAAPNNWQEVRRLTLPNSGLRVGVSTLRYEFLPGEAELLPDLPVWPEPSDWGAGQDASLRLILSQP